MDNTDIFVINLHDMPIIDPSIECHHLNVDVKARYISQRRRRQSPKKVETTSSKVKGILDTWIISEVKYIEWLSNIVLVKKAFEKWKMCVNYMDLNRDCSM